MKRPCFSVSEETQDRKVYNYDDRHRCRRDIENHAIDVLTRPRLGSCFLRKTFIGVTWR